MKIFNRSCVSNTELFIEADLSSDVIARIADMTSFDRMQNDNSHSWMGSNKEGAKFIRKGTSSQQNTLPNRWKTERHWL